MNEINVIDHAFRRRMMLEIGGEYTGFGYEYFDCPDSLTGFRGYRSDGNAAEGQRDFAAEARAISLIPGVKSVFDIGCAKGFLVKALRGLGVEAYGIDVSDYAIELADPDIRPYLRRMGVQDLASGEQFDLVHVNGVLVYLTLSEIKRALRRFHEIARVGIMVEQPTREQILSWYEREDVAAIDPLRKQELSEADWERLIAEAGFEKDTTHYRKRFGAHCPPTVSTGSGQRSVELHGA
jgi:2-polyprenyl-3-methyl-5-hydroxy-6-metoxy-1,4-benzoquinol methylase